MTKYSGRAAFLLDWWRNTVKHPPHDIRYSADPEAAQRLAFLATALHEFPHITLQELRVHVSYIADQTDTEKWL